LSASERNFELLGALRIKAADNAVQLYVRKLQYNLNLD
jgi:hypothetical protein